MFLENIYGFAQRPSRNAAFLGAYGQAESRRFPAKLFGTIPNYNALEERKSVDGSIRKRTISLQSLTHTPTHARARNLKLGTAALAAAAGEQQRANRREAGPRSGMNFARGMSIGGRGKGTAKKTAKGFVLATAASGTGRPPLVADGTTRGTSGMRRPSTSVSVGMTNRSLR